MTQSTRGKPPVPQPLTQRPRPGTVVRILGSQRTGVVVQSDEFYATLRLPGLTDAQQALVEWPRPHDGAARLWHPIGDLEAVK